MNRIHLTQWLERIYATAEAEMDCEQLQAILPAYVEAEIAGGDVLGRFLQVKAHVAQCPDCAEEYAGLREVARLESRGRLPQVEDILAEFEEAPAPEPGETVPVTAS